VNEWIGIIGIIVAILVPLVGGIIVIIIKLSSRVTKNETNIDNIKDLLQKQATQEGVNALDRKIDLFYSLIRTTADTLVVKHADEISQHRKSLISANNSLDRLEKENEKMRKELEKK